MRTSKISIEPHLIEAFLSTLKDHGYEITESTNPTQPYWLSHKNSPHINHIIELDQYGKAIIPDALIYEALKFCSTN